MSIHEVKVIRIGASTPHPNADSLELLTIHGGYTCIVRIGQFPDGSLAAYIEPDYEVSLARPEFCFLQKPGRAKGWERIRVKRLRGVLSHGLLVAAPAGASEGDNVLEQLGVRRYEPPMPTSTGGEAESPPPGLYAPCYDVEPLRKYLSAFIPGEEVIVTEKLHGASGRWVFHAGRMWCGSRNEWKRESSTNLWWQALLASPWLVAWCNVHPGHVVYGEVYGQVQDLKYGHPKGKVSIAVFDVLLPGGTWMDGVDLLNIGILDLACVPLVARCQFEWCAVQRLAKGESIIPGADHVREGVVVKPIHERTDPMVGRVNLKLINDDYLER